MPMHDWTRVDAGIYHDFHHEWISEIKRTLNRGVLPTDYYALAEQHTGGFGPDVLTLQEEPNRTADLGQPGVSTQTRPQTRFHVQAERPRKRSVIGVHHVSDDRVVAIIEIHSSGNKAGEYPFHQLLRKAVDLLYHGVHLLIIDPFPPGPRDPQGIHAAIWAQLENRHMLQPPTHQPLTLAAYESAPIIEAFIEFVGVGEALPDMPLFLSAGYHVMVPMEVTYQSAWEMIPARWQRVIAGTK